MNHATPMPTHAMTVKHVLFTSVGGLPQMYGRPFQTIFTNETMFALQTVLKDSITPTAGAKIPLEVLAPNLFNVLAPSRDCGQAVAIPGGWSAERLAFLMEVEVRQLTGKMTVYYSGYTDPVQARQMTDIPADLKLYINQAWKVRDFAEHSSTGEVVQRQAVVSAVRVLAGQRPTDGFNGLRGYDQILRPEDVYSGLTGLHLIGDGVLDLRMVLTDTPRFSRLSEACAPQYVRSLWQGLTEACLLEDIGSGYGDTLTSARGMVANDFPARDPLIRAMAQYYGAELHAYFEYQHLQQLNPEAVRLEQGSQIKSMSTTWEFSSLEAQAATIVGQSLPMALAALNLREAVFIVDNYQPGELTFTELYAVDLSGAMAKDVQVEALKAQLKHSLVNYLSCGDDVRWHLKVRARPFLNTNITVQCEDHAAQSFIWPSFADALLAPVLMSGEQASSYLSDMEFLLNLHPGRR